MNTYTVVDVETSGLSPARGRIVEIGLLLLNEQGEVIDSFESLVDPQGSVGATYIHGITASMVKDAPLFSSLMGDIIPFFRDSVMVAHNVPFDKRFLISEFSRAGVHVGNIPSICTLELSRRFFSHLPSRSLSPMCSFLGIEAGRSHTALDDCRAAASLFQILRRRIAEENLELGRFIRGDQAPEWPALESSGQFLTRSSLS